MPIHDARLLCFIFLLMFQSSTQGNETYSHHMSSRSASSLLTYPSQNNRSELYSMWSQWSQCSRTCGFGISRRTRSCERRSLRSVNSNFPMCPGEIVEHKICKLKECPPGSMDFRAHQCSQYNNRIIAGRMVSIWTPSNGGQNPCELRCQAKSEKLVYGFGKVADGTSCSSSSQMAVCLDGRCLNVGCDERLGSEVTMDMCGVCGGRDSTCIHYKDVYTGQPALSPDSREYKSEYKEVAVIPIGARNLEVRQHLGRNVLAMQDRNNGVIFNSDEDLRRLQAAHHLAGTVVIYHREGNVTEILKAQGPTTQDLYIRVLLRDKNHGIHYEYWLLKGQTHPQRSYVVPPATSTSPPKVLTYSPTPQPGLPKVLSSTTAAPVHRTQPVTGFPSPVAVKPSPKAKEWNSNVLPGPKIILRKPVNASFLLMTPKSVVTPLMDQVDSPVLRPPAGNKTAENKTELVVSPTLLPVRKFMFKPRYQSPKSSLGFYQVYRNSSSSRNDFPDSMSSKDLLPVDTQGDSGGEQVRKLPNDKSWISNSKPEAPSHKRTVPGFSDKDLQTVHAKAPKVRKGSVISENSVISYPIEESDRNLRWKYSFGKNGDYYSPSGVEKGHYGPTPVTISVLPLPDTSRNHTVNNRKRKGRKHHSKSRLTRGGLCEPCQKVRDQTKHFCTSDFVIRAAVAGVEFIHGETRYELEVLQSFKNTFALLPREYVWSPDTCRCPKLRVGREYILMGRSDNNYRKNESRLLVDKSCFVRTFNPKYARRLLRLRKDQLHRCRRVS